MSKLYYIIGKSGVGKDTIYKRLVCELEGLVKTIVTYTTRPIREGEKEGVEYRFQSEVQMQDLINKGLVIENRTYDTYYGQWHYYTVNDDQLTDLHEHGDVKYLCIGTLESYISIRNYFGDRLLSPIYITLDDGIRLRRAIDREMLESEPKYEELCRRYIADAIDFSDERLELAGIYDRFDNRDIDKCVDMIKEYIIGEK